MKFLRGEGVSRFVAYGVAMLGDNFMPRAGWLVIREGQGDPTLPPTLRQLLLEVGRGGRSAPQCVFLVPLLVQNNRAAERLAPTNQTNSLQEDLCRTALRLGRVGAVGRWYICRRSYQSKLEGCRDRPTNRPTGRTASPHLQYEPCSILQVHQKLGKGKFGIVYRAKIKHSSGSKGVALKLLSKVRRGFRYLTVSDIIFRFPE